MENIRTLYENFIDTEQIDGVNAITPRVALRLHERAAAEEHIAVERARIVTESWQSTDGEPLDIRRAKLFRAIMERNPIAIHDGARPLVDPAHIAACIRDARVFGGATLGVPVKDTIKVVDDGLIVDTPQRATLWITQTPQVFRKRLYYEAVDFTLEHGLDFTDDCQLVEAIGGKVYMTRGDYTNIKITTPEDKAVAEALLAAREKEAQS